MKKMIFGILIGFLFVITSCNDDVEGYSLNDSWLGFGMVENSDSYRIKMDNGDVLVPVAYDYNPWYDNDYMGNNHKIEKGDRVLVNYTILDDDTNDSGEIDAYFVKINSANKVLMKGILDLTEENADSIGNNPIEVREVWMTDSLLNFHLRYYGRYKVHFINLVKQPGTLTADGQPFELELRHNDNGDDAAIDYTAFVSFHLDSLQVAGLDSVSFKVTSTDYDGDAFEYNGVYKYGENE